MCLSAEATEEVKRLHQKHGGYTDSFYIDFRAYVDRLEESLKESKHSPPSKPRRRK